jgi:hypothetical protein
MTTPRIFISSTYYDLKHIRSSLENFIETLGYEPILSEKGDIAYAPDIALDKSCYREVQNSDIFVLIIGGRYGAEKTEGKGSLSAEFYNRYDSITKQEYASAVEKDVPIYVLIEKAVYADFETYLRNKTNSKIKYAHVDSINIFHLIEQIMAQPRNNPIHHFDKYAEIEAWLREQWAGLFCELLTRMSSQQQLASLASQVHELGEVNKTLKAYLEEVVSKIAPEESAKLIKAESERLDEAMQTMIMENSPLVAYLMETGGVSMKDMRIALTKSTTVEAFVDALEKKYPDNSTLKDLLQTVKEPATRDFKLLRHRLQNPEEAVAEMRERNLRQIHRPSQVHVGRPVNIPRRVIHPPTKAKKKN